MAESIIDSAISYYSHTEVQGQIISFDFRERDYSVEWRSSGVYYESSYQDSLGRHKRQLDNGAYAELLDGDLLDISPEDAVNRRASVNSVLYFGLLPYHLRDEAVKSQYLGIEVMDGDSCYKIEVRFDETDGGDDFQDVFLYWFDTSSYAMRYLAYSYIEDEGGTRFRAAYNARRINGIMFQDYENFRGPSDPDSLKYISSMYSEGTLPLLSKIEVNQIRVEAK